MSKYKVGDKVLLQGKVFKIEEDNIPYPYGIRIAKNVEFMFGEEEMISKTYADGLADAWELARKIMLNAEDNFSCDQVEEIFGRDCFCVLGEFTPQEALAKIEAYEKSQQIEIGDVVYSSVVDSKEGICVGRGNDGQEYALVWFKEYDCPQNMSLKDLKKTGWHIDISKLLEKIRGDQ